MDFYLGQIVLFAGSYTPQGWMKCDGTMLAIVQYEALFSIIGTNYGGDGQDSFALPKLDSVTTTGTGHASIQYIICTYGVFPSMP